MKNQKFTYKELKEMQSWPLEDKILRANQLIASELKSSKKPVVACSFGKTSMVMLHLVRNFCKNAVVLFENTHCQFPETYEYRDLVLKEWNVENYYETHPIEGWDYWRCVKEKGFPQFRKMSKQGKARTPYCCKVLKDRPAKRFLKEYGADCEFVGLQASESMVRRLSFFREGEAFNSKKWGLRLVRPMMIWTDKDIWNYHKNFGIPYLVLYDKMPRNGCMPCTAFKNWKKIMAKTNPKLSKIIHNKMGQPLLEQFNEVPCQ